MNAPSSDISVIVCAYTLARWNTLVRGISALSKQTLVPREIILVVDHSPMLLERAQAELQGLRVIENTQAKGLSGARNSGIAAARGSVLAFLDDDATPASDWLEKLTRNFIDPGIMGVGGKLEPVWMGGRPAWFPEEFLWVIGCSYRGLPEERGRVRNPIGGNMAIRRSVFDAIGGFRTGISLSETNATMRYITRSIGCDETELCIRAQQQFPDQVFVHEPEARAGHQVTAERASVTYFCTRCYNEGVWKAALSKWLGANDSLSSERAYTLRILPSGIARGIGEVISHRDLSGMARAAAIVGGLLCTVAGYLKGRLFIQTTAEATRPKNSPLVTSSTQV